MSTSKTPTPRASAYLPPIVRYGDQPLTPEAEVKLRALILSILHRAARPVDSTGDRQAQEGTVKL